MREAARSDKLLGYIGVGLMGHGAAKNILAKGHPLTILGHRNRQPVEDLVARGALEMPTAAAVAAASDVVFTCLPSSVEVEAAVLGEGGIRGCPSRHDPRRPDDRRSQLDAPPRQGLCPFPSAKVMFSCLRPPFGLGLSAVMPPWS